MVSDQFITMFQQLRQLLIAFTTSALEHPSCQQLAFEAANDRTHHCRLVVVFFTSRAERAAKLLDSYRQHQGLVEAVQKLVPKIPEGRRAIAMIEYLQKELPGFGWSMIIEAVSKSSIVATPTTDMAADIARRRAEAYRNAPRLRAKNPDR